jgi:excisionase family DNA binding protein
VGRLPLHFFREIAEGVMKSPAYWRDLRSEFGSLDPSVSMYVFFRENDPENHISADTPRQSSKILERSTRERFRTFAARGGVGLGVGLERAIEAWLRAIRSRLPHHFHEIIGSGVERELREIPFSQLIPPAEDIIENRRVEETIRAEDEEREVRGLGPRDEPSTFIVEPLGDRYLIVDGRRLYDSIAALGRNTVRCYFGEAVEVTESGGYIETLRVASMELCEQLETEALADADIHREVRELESDLQSNATSVGTHAQASKVNLIAKDRLVTVKGGAKILGVSEDTIRRWAKDGEIQLVKVGRRRTQLRMSEINRRIESGNYRTLHRECAEDSKRPQKAAKR